MFYKKIFNTTNKLNEIEIDLYFEGLYFEYKFLSFYNLIVFPKSQISINKNPNQSVAMEVSPMLTYFSFGENCLMFIVKPIAIVTIGWLFICKCFFPTKLRVSHLSPSILFYLGNQFVGSVVTLP